MDEIPEGLSVAEVEMMLNGVAVKIEELEGKVQTEPPYNGQHIRSTICMIDGKLCRVSVRTGPKNKFGN